METEINLSKSKSESGGKKRLTPHLVIMILIWLVTSGVLIWMLTKGVRENGGYRSERMFLQALYALVLLFFLNRNGPSLARIPEVKPILLEGSIIGRWIPVILVALIFYDVIKGNDNLLPIMMIACIWILVAWRKEIRKEMVALGIGLALVALIAGLTLLLNHYTALLVYIGLPLFVPLMFIAGGLLMARTEFGGSKLMSGQYREAVKSFLAGCLLFIPFGLFNAAGGSMRVSWLTRAWMPITQPLFSGITEEMWFRFFLVCLIFFLLRPAFRRIPVLAAILALLFSAITFGLGHSSGTFFERFVEIGLLYGLPLAVVFCKRDYEHAVGGHYMINMIPAMMAFLSTLK